MSGHNIEYANNRQNRFYCLSDLESKYRSHAKEKIRRVSIEKFNGLVPESINCMQIYDDITFASLSPNCVQVNNNIMFVSPSPIGVDEQNDKLNDSSEKVKKCLENATITRQCGLAKKIRSASFDARHDKISLDTVDSELSEKDFETVQQINFEIIQEKHFEMAQQANFDIINNVQRKNIDDKKAPTVYKHKTFLRNRLPLGEDLNFPLLDINNNDINKDLEIINQFNRDNLLKKFGIDLAKDENTKITTKTEVFLPNVSEANNFPLLNINNDDINKDLEIINRFNRDNLLKKFGIDLAKDENTKVTTKAEEFPAKNLVNIQNKNNKEENVEKNENHASEGTVSGQNDILFFDESVIKQIEPQNNDSFVLDDLFDKDCFEVNKSEQFNILPQTTFAFDLTSKKSKTEFEISSTQDLNFISATEKFVPNDINDNKDEGFEILSQGASNPKSAERRNVLWFLKVIKWLSGIFGCGFLISLFILWQFFNPLLTAVSITAFLVGLSIDTAIFVVAWRACSYLNNSVHESNNFSHLPENNSSQIEINNQNENKNQSPIPNSDNKDNNLAKQ